MHAHPGGAMVLDETHGRRHRTCALPDRQIAAQAKSFENEGGFTERLYRVRSAVRRNQN
jgi:four helix bundle suffix protein